ncbi:alpha/beta fold hydrolase [Phenylobacterium montanum]|uniref:Alpha/beta hydrolase n=1 Tax=Phenylobacterium montanum TaxID=2823693 RepID=A0A975FYD2_9CAUL|nr:alpha/beta hydrolase [Caulobacter sp. S6]QUD87441.1 alpha/beta hydrolase [Caulobacter sp. S6]
MLSDQPRKLRDRRPKGVIGVGWAAFESAALGRSEHAPTANDYPDTVVRRIQVRAGGGLGWTLSALETPRQAPTPWKIVVITGAPSWAEYWAPVLAALPEDRHMVVVDRPGFALSEPQTCVPDIRIQAAAMAPLLEAAPGQKVLLVGQSYGAAIATLMAAEHPRKVSSLVLLSSFLGEFGPTSRWLVDVGERFSGVIPRDLRHAVIEVTGHTAQLAHMRRALPRLRAPVHVIHGDKDDFAPIEAVERLLAETPGLAMRFHREEGANHFLNDGPPETLVSLLEGCLPPAKPRFAWPKLRLPWLRPRRALAPMAASAPSIASPR